MCERIQLEVCVDSEHEYNNRIEIALDMIVKYCYSNSINWRK